MNRFEPPPPLPGSPGQEPADPYAPPTASRGHQPYSSARPAPQAPWGAPASYTHPRGTTVLVLGILSIVVLPLLGPFAWVMGRRTLKEIDAAPRPAANRSMVLAGMVLGMVSTILTVLVVLAIFLFVGVLILAL